MADSDSCCWVGCNNPPSSFYFNGWLNFCELHFPVFEDHRRRYAETMRPRRVRLRRRLANLIDPERG